jgi:hypothetical protein
MHAGAGTHDGLHQLRRRHDQMLAVVQYQQQVPRL